jgi:hypothetical protein
MAEAQQQARQLDSVTDFHTETEIDASKAQQAMSALANSNKADDPKAAALAAVAVSKEDIAVIVSELEVTDQVAERTLREVVVEGADEKKMLEAALRKLVTS